MRSVAANQICLKNTETFKCIGNSSEKTYEPFDFGYDYVKQEELHAGNTIEEAAKIFLNVLSDKATKEQKKVVIINSALAMNCFNSKKSLEDCMAQCKETIESKKAFNLFNKIINKN